MSTHLTSAILSCLADGELSSEQLAIAQQHLESCSACTSKALAQALLKAAVSKSGHRYSPSPDLADRLRGVVSEDSRKTGAPASPLSQAKPFRVRAAAGVVGWALAAMLLLTGIIVVRRNLPSLSRPSGDRAALVTEISDLHVAALADTAPAQVISTDRHTVKPWFQGKIPFTFNLPEQLPADVKLEGANLIYLEGQPVAQLFYSVGRHRVSVFVRQRSGKNTEDTLPQEHSGFHLAAFKTDELQAIAISDVEPARLAELTSIIERVQTREHK